MTGMLDMTSAGCSAVCCLASADPKGTTGSPKLLHDLPCTTNRKPLGGKRNAENAKTTALYLSEVSGLGTCLKGPGTDMGSRLGSRQSLKNGLQLL